MHDSDDLVSLEVGPAKWDRFFIVSPLVVIGTAVGYGNDLPGAMVSQGLADQFAVEVATIAPANHELPTLF